MAGEQADMVFTDPPYNVAYEGYTKDKLTIQGDRMSPQEFDHFLRGSFDNYRESIKPGGSLYVCHASSVQREFQNALEAAGFNVRCQIIWAKNTSPGDLAATSFSTSRSSIAMYPARAIPGTATNPNPRFGRRRSPPQTGCTPR